MTSGLIRWQQTPRDVDILRSLDLCPLESKDLLALSGTFAQPFHSLDRVRRTLKRLEAAGQVRSWRYAMSPESGGSAPLYYKLTLDGYRTLHRSELAMPPTKRYLSEIGFGRHFHQQSLSRYIVRTHIAAHQQNLRIIDSFPENTFRIETPYGPLFPDRRFTVVTSTGGRFVNCVELDNSTETLVSRTDVDSIELKMKKYLHNLKENNYGYRVQFIVTRSAERVKHIRQLAAKMQPPVQFAPFYVVLLAEYLDAENPFLDPIFTSSRSARIALLRSHAEMISKRHETGPPGSLLSPVALC